MFNITVTVFWRVVPKAFAEAATVPWEPVPATKRKDPDLALWLRAHKQELATPLDRERALREAQVVDAPPVWVRVPDCIVEGVVPGTAWRVAARIVTAGGGWLISDLRVFPKEPDLAERPKGLWVGDLLGVRAPCPPQGVTAKLLRAVPLGKLYREVDRVVREVYKQFGERAAGTPFGLFGLQPRGRRLRGPRGRRRIPDLELARAATAYATAAAAGSRKPVGDAATTLGLAKKRVRDLVHQARQRGLLEPKALTQGSREGGRLTAKARALLGEPSKEVSVRRIPAVAPRRESTPRKQ